MKQELRQLQTDWIETQLRQIASLLIEAHKKGDGVVLDYYARRLPGFSKGSPKRQFMQLIQVFHPDRLAVHVNRSAECIASGNTEDIASLRSFLTYEAITIKPSVSHLKNDGKQYSPSVDDFNFEESYQYSEDDFGFGEDTENFEGAGHDNQTESGYEKFDDPFVEGSFLDAIKREFFGNLDLFPSRFEIEQFDGELDLSDYNIHDLAGAEYCINIHSLNLAMNRIDNIWPLKYLSRLEFLDLSSNALESADDLAALPLLGEIDLSFNEIDDISFLLELPSLSCVALIGNPVQDAGVIGKLRKKGVIVIN